MGRGKNPSAYSVEVNHKGETRRENTMDAIRQEILEAISTADDADLLNIFGHC